MKKRLKRVIKAVMNSAPEKTKGGDALVALVAPERKKVYSVVLDEQTKGKIDRLAKSAGVSFSKAAGYVLERHIDTEISATEKAKIRR